MRNVWLSIFALIPISLFAASAPAPPTSAKIEQRIARDVAWYRAALPLAYERAGVKNAKWDAAATEALTAAALVWSNDPNRPGNEQERAWQTSHRAIKAGCDDALVQYVHARMYTQAAFESSEESVQLARSAASALDRSSYSTIFKLLGHIHAARAIIDEARERQTSNAPDALIELDAAKALWPKVTESLDTPHELVLDMFKSYLDARRDFLGDRKVDASAIVAAYETHAKKDVILPLLRARLLVDTAWDARGTARIDRTTETAQKVFGSRLDEAAREVMKALAIDPASPSLAPLMIAVELGTACEREEMESWFRYGLTVDPGSLSLWFARLHHLEPRWHGSKEGMLEVGQEALATKQWSLRVPFLLIFAHHQLAEEEENYFDPSVCRDVHAVYDPYLKLYPEAQYERSGYAFLLYRCGDYTGANREIKRLGTDRRLGPFRTRANFDKIRVEAALRAK
ncbi:MAG TPA: hypothetical protein VMU84_07420 [Thermoanaerobaculia bacterium]|nr:hypothetical protein [Thermoanaerobaculia bacterium]